MEPERALLSREELRTKFGVVNYLVFLAMLLVSAAIGAYFWWRGQRSTGSTLFDHVYGHMLAIIAFCHKCLLLSLVCLSDL